MTTITDKQEVLFSIKLDNLWRILSETEEPEDNARFAATSYVNLVNLFPKNPQLAEIMTQSCDYLQRTYPNNDSGATFLSNIALELLPEAKVAPTLEPGVVNILDVAAKKLGEVAGEIPAIQRKNFAERALQDPAETMKPILLEIYESAVTELIESGQLKPQVAATETLTLYDQHRHVKLGDVWKKIITNIQDPQEKAVAATKSLEALTLRKPSGEMIALRDTAITAANAPDEQDRVVSSFFDKIAAKKREQTPPPAPVPPSPAP